MFHRVKSEAPQSFQTQQNNEQQDMAEKDKDNRPQERAQSQNTQNVQKQNTQKPEQSNQQKDARTMNKQDQNTTNEDDNVQETGTMPRRLDIPGSAYQRAGAAPVKSYPGAYPGAYSAPSASAAAEAVGDRRLTIGRGITMSGEIEHCDHLLVEGTVEAALKGAKILDIAETGVFYGAVEIDEATVAGRFEGDITVNGRLTVRTGGMITGSIAYKEIELEAGATIEGRMTPLGGGNEAKRPQPGKKQESGHNMPKKMQKDMQEPANSDGELFSKTAAE